MPSLLAVCVVGTSIGSCHSCNDVHYLWYDPAVKHYNCLASIVILYTVYSSIVSVIALLVSLAWLQVNNLSHRCDKLFINLAICNLIGQFALGMVEVVWGHGISRWTYILNLPQTYLSNHIHSYQRNPSWLFVPQKLCKLLHIIYVLLNKSA